MMNQRRSILSRVRLAAKAFFGNIQDAETYIRLGSRASTGGELEAPYSQNAWVRRAASLIATSISQLPFVPEEGEKPNVRVANDPALNQLLDDPNPEMTRGELLLAINLLLDLEGTCLLYLPGRDNVAELPDEIWPLPKAGWEPIRDRRSKVVTGWKYDEGAGVLPPWNIVMLKLWDPRNRFWGLSCMESALLSASADYQGLKMANRAFENDASPGGILYAQGDLTDEKFEQYRTQWNQRHGGVENKRRIAVLDGGLKYEATEVDMTKLEASEGRVLNREDIAAAFGLPPEVLGLGRTTFANRAEAVKAMWEETLLPRTVYIAEVFTERIVQPATGNRIKMRFDTTGVSALQANLTEKVTQGRSLHESGLPWVEINRRLDMKLERFPGDETAWMPLAVQPVGEDTEVGPPPAPEEPVDMPPKKRRKEGHTAEWRTARWNAIAKTIFDPNEKRLVGRLRKYFYEQGAATMRRFREVVGTGGKAAGGLTDGEVDEVLFADEAWNAELSKAAKPVVERIIADTGRDLEENYGLSFDPRQPVFAAFLERKLQRFASDVNGTTKDAIRTTLTEGIAAGETVTELAARVRGVFEKADASRAATIARTETAEAANGTRFLVFEESGVTKHEWLSAHDAEVRDSHAEEDGNVVDIGSEFPVTGLKYPGQVDGPPEEVINCRCVAEPVVGGES